MWRYKGKIAWAEEAEGKFADGGEGTCGSTFGCDRGAGALGRIRRYVSGDARTDDEDDAEDSVGDEEEDERGEERVEPEGGSSTVGDRVEL